MPIFFEVILIIITMMGSFFLAFMVMFVLALFLSPIEQGLSKMVWGNPPPPPKEAAPKGSFKDFSKKQNT